MNDREKYRQQLDLALDEMERERAREKLAGPAEEDVWREYLAGLPSGRVAITGSWETAPEPLPPIAEVPVTIHHPDGRWQAFKSRWKERWPRLLGWLKVRYRIYEFSADLEPQWEVTVDADEELVQAYIAARSRGPITRRLEEW